MQEKFTNGISCERGAEIFTKKAKTFYRVEGHSDLVIMRFLDRVATDDNSKIQEIPGKGQLNCAINSMLFGLLKGQYTDRRQDVPIKTHFLANSTVNKNECLVSWAEEVLPLEVIMRNRAYGSICDRYRVEEGKKFKQPICEFCFKDDELHDPLLNDEHIEQLGLAYDTEMKHMKDVARAVNRIMSSFFAEIGIELVDFKLVFGRLHARAAGDPTNLRLIGSLTPDISRLRDMQTGEILDKDIFRRYCAQVSSDELSVSTPVDSSAELPQNSSAHSLSELSEAYAKVLQKMQQHQLIHAHRYCVDGYDKYGNALK